MLSTPDNLVRNGSYFPAVVPQPFLHVARTALANAMDGIFAARDSCSALCSGANALLIMLCRAALPPGHVPAA